MSEQASTPTPGEPGSPRKLLRRLLIWACWGALAFCILFMVVLLPNQVRPIAEPDLSFSGRGGGGALGTPAGSRDDPTSASKTTARVSFADLSKACRPIQDVSALPESLRGPAELWNQAVEELLPDLLSLRGAAAGMTYEDAREELRRIQKAYYEHLNAYYKARRALGGDTTAYPNAEENYREWTMVVGRTEVVVAAQHQQWNDAAVSCLRFSLRDDVDTDLWWDREVYYWRRCGLRGRAIIAARTIEPYALPVVKRLRRALDAAEAAWGNIF